MAETNNVFISWSGPRSKSAAEALKQWLPLVVPTANPWVSATDIDKGTRWREEVAAALDTMRAGIICLTPENLTAEWLLFEAGALSKPRDPKARVWTYLLADLTIADVTDPLSMFQATKAEEEDTRKLVHSINKNLDAAAPESRVNRLFDKFWPDLKEELAAIPAPSGATPPKRSALEIAGDSLELLRSVAPLIQEIAHETEYIRRKREADEQFSKFLQDNRGVIVSTTSNVVPRAYLQGKLSDMMSVPGTNETAILPPTTQSDETRGHLPSSPLQKKRPFPSGKPRK